MDSVAVCFIIHNFHKHWSHDKGFILKELLSLNCVGLNVFKKKVCLWLPFLWERGFLVLSVSIREFDPGKQGKSMLSQS